MKFIPKSLTQFYFILIWAVAIIELIFMIIGVVQIKFHIELIGTMRNVNFLMLLFFLIMAILVCKYVLCIHKEALKIETTADKGKAQREAAVQEEAPCQGNTSSSLNPAVANYLRTKIQELLGASFEQEAKGIKISLIQRDGQEMMTLENIIPEDDNSATQRLFYLGVPTKNGEGSGGGIPDMMRFIEQNVGQVQVVIDKELRQS
ncbi:hypothetical protein [Brevibacillus reuszeri]|uniref:hypothetical protein n=1 Tax=Brevibacillus reuszeri TaxID=54915 RepID=UPI00289EDD45|nr:hypothetical protein [Brevibacillus reuszeri]